MLIVFAWDTCGFLSVVPKDQYSFCDFMFPGRRSGTLHPTVRRPGTTGTVVDCVTDGVLTQW